MKKALGIIFCLVVAATHYATAQTVMKMPPKIYYSFIKQLGTAHNAEMPNFSLLYQKPKALKPKHHNSICANTDVLNFSLLRSKALRAKVSPQIFNAKFVHNDLKTRPSKPNVPSAFIFTTFEQPEDGSGINITLAARTSLNVDLIGCYEGSDTNAATDNDSCGQSPDLDMSISFVFDLK